MAAFEELGILPEIARAVNDLGWELPTDIQAEAIPLILGGGDVLMAAETGSGKTGAFSLPVVQIVYETIYSNLEKNKKNPDCSDEILLSFNDRHPSIVLSNDFLSCQSKTKFWAGVRANKGVKKNFSNKNLNKVYFEIHFIESGLARFGWSFHNANLDLGTCKFGYGYGGTAKKSNSREFIDYGEVFGDKNDVVGSCLNLNTCQISFTKNGKHLGVAFNLPEKMCEEAIFFPTICTKNAQCSTRFIEASDNFRKSYLPNEYNWIGKLTSLQLVLNPNLSKLKIKHKTCSGPKAIIIEPSRELAEQTLNCITIFKKYLPNPIKEVLILGGVNSTKQAEILNNGVDIIVATLHRLEDLVINNIFSLDECRFFIIDEIDALLQQNNIKLLSNLYSKLPKMFDYSMRLQSIVCSATLNDFQVKKFSNELMYFPIWIDLKKDDSIPDTVHHVLLKVDPYKNLSWKNKQIKISTDGVHERDKIDIFNPTRETYSEAVKILKGDLIIKAIDTLKMDRAIIFCRTKIDCDHLEDYFNFYNRKNQNKQYSCVCLHANRSPAERKFNLDQFKKNLVKFLICTDVAARGIDISGIPFVIQVTLHDDISNYVHRIGRVGRAEKMGLAISLVSTVPEKVWYHNCPSKGTNCKNIKLKENGGCCIWYNELEILADIEEKFKCTIEEIFDNFHIETNEFDGKVIYGSKRTGLGILNYQNHAHELKDIVSNLCNLEFDIQTKFIQLGSLKQI